MSPLSSSRTYRAMIAPDPFNGKKTPMPTRQQEAMWIIEEYAAALREIIKKLLCKLN